MFTPRRPVKTAHSNPFRFPAGGRSVSPQPRCARLPARRLLRGLPDLGAGPRPDPFAPRARRPVLPPATTRPLPESSGNRAERGGAAAAPPARRATAAGAAHGAAGPGALGWGRAAPHRGSRQGAPPARGEAGPGRRGGHDPRGRDTPRAPPLRAPRCRGHRAPGAARRPWRKRGGAARLEGRPGQVTADARGPWRVFSPKLTSGKRRLVQRTRHVRTPERALALPHSPAEAPYLQWNVRVIGNVSDRFISTLPSPLPKRSRPQAAGSSDSDARQHRQQ